MKSKGNEAELLKREASRIKRQSGCPGKMAVLHGEIGSVKASENLGTSVLRPNLPLCIGLRRMEVLSG